VYVKDSLLRTDLALGYSWLARLRIQSFWTGVLAAKAGLIDKKYLKFCPCCGMIVPENVEHFLLRCRAWKTQRKTFISGWKKLIEQGVQANLHPLPGQLSKPELQRNNLTDCDAATRAILIGGCDEFLQTLKGPPDPLGKVAPNALASGDDGKTDPVLETRTSLLRDMAGFLA